MLTAAALCSGCIEQLAKLGLATRSALGYHSLQFVDQDAPTSACSQLSLAMLPVAAAQLRPLLGLAAGAGLVFGDLGCLLLLQLLLLQLQCWLPP
jgi:hypothetical protein